ncbi:type II secretion system protein GspK [Rheinheimera maricola]|uniref:General secretion pathway protein GspK n=1 Tax=Rheinheimera maricola TaxID=2793282 RepID=A0ABS7X644_9GAMM|nr:type II secretion system protein GspK [Rheinheimera maricola]MBZ9610287.1 general secretion pathway protein GspK [Rheinheimera maricola]
MVVKQRGVALILVLLFSAVLTTVIVVNRYKMQLTLAIGYDSKNYVLAKSLVMSKRSELQFLLATSDLWFNGVSSQTLSSLALPADLNFWGAAFLWDDVSVSIKDTSGLLSLIPYESEAWRAMLKGLQIGHADKLVDELSDWIDPDDFIHLNGAEQQDYPAEVSVRNGLPQTIDEVQQLLSMDEDTWRKLHPIITYIGPGFPQAPFLSDHLLEAWLGNERASQTRERRKGSSENIIGNYESGGGSIGGQYPSNRLMVQIKATVGNSSYQESFTLVRGLSTREFLYTTEVKAGFAELEQQ